jgi:hypothetical protein
MAECSGHPAGDIPNEIRHLPESQAGHWRHKCAACAYLLGRRDAATTEENLRKRVRELTEQVRMLQKQLAPSLSK